MADIIQELLKDHEEVRQLMAKIEGSSGKERKQLFQELVSELIKHEVAEEEILRPVSKRLAGERVAQARIEEEDKAEKLIKEMEKLDPAGAEFGRLFTTLHQEVEKHARAEETEEFPMVEQKASQDDLRKMGLALEAAKKVAPTRPHPSAPDTPPGNIMVGPFAAVMDRTRDAVRSAVQSAQG